MASGSDGSSAWRTTDNTGAAFPTACTGVAMAAFYDAGSPGSCRERLIGNPAASGIIWANLAGGVAGPNLAGSIAIQPQTHICTEGSNLMNVYGANLQPLTLLER